MQSTSTQGSQARVTAKPLIKSMKKVPSQLIKEQASGKSMVEQYQKPKIVQFLNISDNSIHIDSQVDVDEPLFSPEPMLIQFANYEPLQTKEQILKLRNKDRVARSVKIIPPDSKLFTVIPAKKSMNTAKKTTSSLATTASDIDQMSSKVAPGMEISYIIRFSPEAKVDFAYDLTVVTEREKFIVPIRARGCLAMLDFPDQLDFGLVPVKFETEKPVMIRNIGEKATKWHIRVPSNFRLSKSEGVLEVGQTEQLVFVFTPQEAKKYADELYLSYEGLEAEIQIIGEAHNDNVFLSKSHIHTDPTSITLFSHQYFEIVNKSTVPIEFSWRAFATEMEEQIKKQRLNQQLTQEEVEERAEIGMALDQDDVDDDQSLDSDDSYDQLELEQRRQRKKEKVLGALSRKYTTIKKAVDEDKMLFQDEIFQIEPLEGKIWPNTEITCCVTFRPQGPYHYSCTAFANVTCNQDRLALNLTGQGKGPQAQLSITEMDIGDIFVTNKKTFELGIENTGEIDCVWKLIPYETPFGSKFKFSETGGKLGVKDHVRDLLKVVFQSDILGEFSETFRFALEGSSEMLTLTFKGHVVAPTFRFSEDIIDFGKISYKFTERRTVYLTNTSEVDINYVIRVPGDGRTLQNEFNIKNERGRLEADKTAEIVIDFTPCMQQHYDNVLVVDLEGVGQDMLAIPIRADCVVPKVRVNPTDLIDYGKCFLKHAKVMQIQIINEDSLRAKFEIVAQDEQSKRIAAYEPDIQSGVIQPHSTQLVNLSLRTEILNKLNVQVYIKLDGHHIPVMLTIYADSTGPIVELDRKELDFLSKPVLETWKESIRITNTSEIEAEYTAFTKQKESIWKVVQRHDVLQPGETKTIDVLCIADEVQKFNDTLHIIVSNGRDEEVPLRIRGTGSTLYCQQLKEAKEVKEEQNFFKVIDFGTEYTYKNVIKQFFLENRGRKPMKIIWARQNKKEKKKASEVFVKDLKSTQSKMTDKEPDEIQVFTVVPDQITLNAKMGIMVEIRANSPKIDRITEQWQCQVLAGNERKPKPIYFVNITGNFITPTLQFNYPKLDFKYLWEKGIPSMPIARDLTIKNTSPLITTIGLKIDPPFSCPIEKIVLEKDACDTVKIEFDPGMKQDRVSDHINGKMTISHDGHPHKDTVLLQGEVCFPNLQILPARIDFGCILNDTSKKKYLVLTNISEMSVAYEWSFLEDAPILNEQDELDHLDTKGKKKKKKKKALPINEVFDILPVSGILQPGQTENVEFTFYSGNGINYSGMAVCSVDGGPDYDVPITGDSNFVNYRLSANEIDFGEIAYNESTTKDFIIENVGKVPFEFNINLSTISRPGVVECSPISGKVIAGEKFKINVKFVPGIPDNIHEMFLVECGHFPAERFTLNAVGIYPGALLSLPRQDTQFSELFEKTKQALEAQKIIYSGMFRGAEAVKHMPAIPPKFTDKEKIQIKDPVQLEIEAEVDRMVLCEKIVQKIQTTSVHPQISIDQLQPSTVTSSQLKAIEAPKPRISSIKEKPKERALTPLTANEESMGMSKYGTVMNFHQINVVTYTCDFGNIIVGKAATKSYRLTNCGKLPISFNFDKKLLNFAGLTIEPDKAQRIMPNQSILFKAVMTTRKTSKYGRQSYKIPVDIKNGPQYTIDFTANLTIPEISMSTDTVDFGAVCVNTRKTIKIRIENKKDVICEWNFHNKSEQSPLAMTASTGNQSQTTANSNKSRDDSDKFQVWPHSGVLIPANPEDLNSGVFIPGQCQTVDIMFTPSADKPYMQKLVFKCNQNQKQFILNVKGQGINYTVDLLPETIQLGPVLPYDTSAIQAFEIRNPMDQPIELFSLDFDKQYLEEEEILKRIDQINPSQPGFTGEPLFLPLRKPGGEFWSSIRQQDERKQQMDAVKAKIKEQDEKVAEMQKQEELWVEFDKDAKERLAKPLEMKEVPLVPVPSVSKDEIEKQRNAANDIKQQLETQLAELISDNLEVNLPPALKEEKRDNIILLGPLGCGKTTAINFLSQEQQRGLIRLDNLFDFFQKRGSPLSDEATQFLEQKQQELEAAYAEQEKQKKVKKPKKGEEEIKINAAEYKYLPKDIIIRMIQKRLQEEDCNAGAMFDCLTSENWPDDKFAISAIFEACGRQNVQIVMFKHLQEKPEEFEMETKYDVCVNYRYAQRHDPHHKQFSDNVKIGDKEKTKTVDLKKSSNKNTSKNVTASSKLSKSNTMKKETKTDAEAEAKAPNVEQEKKSKEIEAKRRRAENLMKQGFKPPIYSEDEKKDWKGKYEDYYAFVSEMIRQVAAATNENDDTTNKYGKRWISEQSIHYDLLFTCEDLKKKVEEPKWPQPDNEPLPPPLINSIQKRPPQRADRVAVTNFMIWTPLTDETRPNSQDTTQKDNQDNGDGLKLTDKLTRWVLQPKESKTLYVKFYSTKTGPYKQELLFEIVGSYKPFTLTANAICEFPSINQNPRNLFLQQKKIRPLTEPESFLSKVYVNSEGVFDFGPLLIGKNPEQRNQEKIKAVNGTFFQITNNGKYDVDLSFALRSSLPAEEGGPNEKSPFIIEPAEASLKIDETLNLQVFAFPDEAKIYKDEVIVLIKDNPNPTILNIQCQGAKPLVNVDHETVKFERALIGKNPQKDLRLKNDCPIPVNWKLTGIEKLSKEFSVSPTEGMLQPCKDVQVHVKFDAKIEKKFIEQIQLHVEDVEGYNIKQDQKNIILDAEAFNITLNDAMQVEQFLDFGAVRVGEPKEQTLYLKNQGLYPIKYEFKMKKTATQAMFIIEPMEGSLNPNEDKNIIVRFLSHKEITLSRAKNLSDITLVILEGDQKIEHQQIPILVEVKAVYSKFSISPLRNLNFGPLQFSEQATRTFEIRNEGLFDFKYNICDFNNEEEKQKIREERQKEMEARLAGDAEEVKEDPKAKNVKKAPEVKKAPVKGAKGAEVIPDGTVLQVSQYSVSPAVGTIAPGSAAVVTVMFNAQGAKFFESNLLIDIANRDAALNPEGIQFQLCAESSIPGINTTDFDQIFEEQTVVPSLDPAVNTQTVISSSIYSIQEKLFWFGTLIAQKNTEGAKERFKIINPNKIPCTIKFTVKPRSQSKSEGFAFDVSPEGLTIDPHKHKYVTVGFYPTAMMQYSAIFEGTVEHGNDETKQNKLVFELRGEGTLPTLQIQKPTDTEADGTAVLRFKKVRIGKDLILPIILKNEGQVPATARFDAITNEAFSFEGNMSQTISAKSFHSFDIKYKPTKIGAEKFMLNFSTLNNLFEQHKVLLQGEGFNESIIFEGLPNGSEDELHIGDCVIGKARAVQFQLTNNGEKDVKFKWSSGDKDEFKFFPQVGHLKARSSKVIKVMVKGTKTAKYDNINITCETHSILQKPDPENPRLFNDWDDSMKTLRMVRPSEYRKIMQERKREEEKRREEAEVAAQAAAGKKPVKAPAGKDKKVEVAQVEEDVVVNMDEDPIQELIEVITEPEFTKVEGSDRAIILKTSCVIDYANYACEVKQVDFKPTLMYAQRVFKFTVKNTSLIGLNYNFKIVNSNTAVLDAGPYTIIPKKGTIAPECDENFILKFSPIEVENDFSRLLSANIQNLNPALEPLCIELNGVADRPIIHFELQPTTFVKADKEGVTDGKTKVIEFISLGTNIRNTKRFMTTNPTSQGYEFEWEEIIDEKKKQKPAFKCMTMKGLILSGKKAEMVFEYIPESVGEHESRWLFKIPSENITQHFLVVGKVTEPNIMFESGKLKFGPLLISGHNKETVKISNQEHIPFAFNFSKESIRGSSDYGDSLQVVPISGVVPALSSLPIEITFTPKHELTYNYNLVCNVKRKARPLILNVKGEGYKIHHTVRVIDTPPIEAQSTQPTLLELGDFFINEKKTKVIQLNNSGEFNFDFVWKRAVNKYVTITPDTGTVKTGGEVKIELNYLPIAEHELKNYKATLSIVSGPRYEFMLNAKARRPGVKLNQNLFDFGPCFVTGNPTAIKKMLYITNVDKQALTIETNFEKKTYLDFQVTPGQVIMPTIVDEPPKKNDKLDHTVKVEPRPDDRLAIPIIFTPREIKKYSEVIKLDFNGLYQIDVTIKGQGIPMLLDLKDPDQMYTDFGAVSVNADVTKVIPLINRSAKAIKFRIEPGNKEKFAKSFLTLSHDDKTDIVLKPKEQLPLEVRFRPKQRLQNFEHEIYLAVDGMEERRKVVSLLGAAHGIELKIMDEQIAFGSVVKDSRLTKNLQMSNFGDVKANFTWDKKALGDNFTISPISGFINPNSNLDLEITFHPKIVDNAINSKVVCSVQGGEPFTLSLMGKSVKQEGNDSLKLDFKSVVRKHVTQNIPIQNAEDKEWAINPTISTKDDACKGYFQGKPTFIVPPKSTAQYEVIYCPKTMTRREKKEDGTEGEEVLHKGSIFFPLPNGTALLYNLNGQATEPAEEGTITQTVAAKKQKNFIVKVNNPFKTTKRFHASWKVDNVEKSGLFIRGSNIIDVDGEGSKEYKLNFLALKSGVYKFKLTFLIKETGEYMFYNFAITVEESQDIEEIYLVSPIREVTTHQVVLENPTDLEVKIERNQFTFAHDYVELQPDSLVLKAHEAKEFTIRYRPLMITEKDETMIVLKNPILGDYKFKLFLKGIAPSSQRSLAFKCSLGQDQMQPFKFQHFLKKATNYVVKVERVDGTGLCDFKAEVASVPAPIAENQKGVELSVNVRYEPYTIGDSRAILKLTSPEAMEYTCMLFGKSSAPQPQGPIKVPAGPKPIGIDFKNPLIEKVEFTAVFDNPNFQLASKPAGLLDPGKTTNFQIKYDAKADLPSTGRMIVSAKGLPPWIYYLQGE